MIPDDQKVGTVVAYTTGDINTAAKTSPHVPRSVVRPAVWLVSPHFIQAAISLTARKPPLSGRYFLNLSYTARPLVTPPAHPHP